MSRNCYYIIHTENGVNLQMSYEELLKFVSQNVSTDKRDTITDIIFSKQAKERLYNSLLNIKKEYIVEKKKDQLILVNGEPSYKEGISVLEFLDNPNLSSLNGFNMVTPFNIDDYKKNQILKLIELGIKESDANKIVDNTIDNWEKIEDDSVKIHSILTHPAIFKLPENGGTDIAFLNSIKKKDLPDFRYADTTKKLYDLLKELYVRQRAIHFNASMLTNINFDAELSTVQGLKILGHIDFAFIGADGRLYLYLYKTSTVTPNNWVSARINKYKALLALLKAMLANRGINVKDIELNIIPICINYDDNFKLITSIKVHNIKSYSSNKIGNYGMRTLDLQAMMFFQDNSLPLTIKQDYMKTADNIIHHLFPNLNIVTEGISLSAEMWIAQAPSANNDGSEPLTIKEIIDQKYAYLVTINGKEYFIAEKSSPKNNKEIFELVNKHIEELQTNIHYSASRLRDAIITRYKKGYDSFANTQGFENSGVNLNAALSKYFAYIENTTGLRDYYWELDDLLSTSNILIFRKIKGDGIGTIDVVSWTPFNLNAKAKFRRGNSILGNFKETLEYNDLPGTYGNIELVRAMELINELYPLLEHLQNMKFGTITVINSSTHDFKSLNMGRFNQNYFDKIIQTLQEEHPELNAKNNLKDATFLTLIEQVLDRYNSLTMNELTRNRFDELGFDLLKLAKSKDLAKVVLLDIMSSMFSLNEFKGLDNPQAFRDKYISATGLEKQRLELLYLIMLAYQDISGENVLDAKDTSIFERNFFPSFTLSDPNMKVVINGLITTINTIASEFMEEYVNKGMRNKFMTFYEKCGYSKIQNDIIGNLAQQYKNFYDTTSEYGKRFFCFKNPYDMTNDLKPYERELLKEVLYKIRYIHTNGNFARATVTPKWIEEHPDYLWVPLKRASQATALLSVDGMFSRLKRGVKAIMDSGLRFDELFNGMDAEERAALGRDDDSIYGMGLTNFYDRTLFCSSDSERNIKNKRETLIANRGIAYFETNLENILTDFLFQQIKVTLMNKFLIVSKAFLIEMHMTGNFSGNLKVVEKEIKWLEDYLKLNVFDRSIMSKAEREFMGVVMPIRRVVSHMFLAGNIVSWFRDLAEGVQQNFIRAAIKLHTDVDTLSLAAAYAYVTTHATHNGMALNLLNQLCLKYRLSNVDVNRIAERAHSGRNGIFNFNNLMYGTLRSPDFHNRMILFVAKCMHDGVWDALSVDKDGNLKYDWKKDKRFKDFAADNVSSPNYKKLKALFMSLVQAYNLEHPTLKLLDINGQELPSPYSEKMVMSIAATADNIYGAYDKSKKAMAENHSWGLCFGMFSTWMNGIVNNYFMSAQKSTLSRLTLTQAKDDNGNLLFYDDEGHQVTEDTGVPVFNEIPIPILGIFPTIITLVKRTHREGWLSTMDYLKANPLEKANLRKITSDILMALFMLLLFKYALKPAYEEYKKDLALDNSLLLNLMVEIVYKGTSRSYDQFLGPLLIIQYIGSNMNSPIYSAPILLMRETFESIFGDHKWLDTLLNNTGFTRSGKDSFKIEAKKNK